MANSSELGAGDVKLLKIQYNALRQDVLDPATGHVHTGGAGEGKQIPTGGLEDGAATTAKIDADAVDDTKAGARVPQFYRRQGGSATEWDTSGTTARTPGAVRQQAGAIEWTGESDTSGAIEVTFPVAFAYKPLVFIQALDYGVVTDPSTISASAFTISWSTHTGGSRTSVHFFWFAVGTE